MARARTPTAAGNSESTHPPSSWNLMLRALREARGVTQDGWAALLGVGRTTVQRWERGEGVPDAHAEAALIAVCRDQGLLRSYDTGGLAGIDVTAAWLTNVLASARLSLAPVRGSAPASP